MTTRWSGGKDAGGPTYRPDEYASVSAVLAQCIDPYHAKTVEEIATLTRIGSRTVRAALSDHDGSLGVVAFTEGGGVYLAEYAEDAEAYTRKLEAQIGTMQRRIARRQEATRRLPRRQYGLFS